jgi:hypothetical protein
MLNQRMRLRVRTAFAVGGLVAAVVLGLPAAAVGGRHGLFLPSLGAPALVASTVPTMGPAAGDQNPYGVAVVPRSVGALVRDRVLVSNFNAASNLQGTGTTIMQVDPRTETASVFAQISPTAVPGCTGGVGLTTALAVFRQGWVIVGSLPVSDAGQGSPAAGCLIVLNSAGTPVETITGPTVNGAPLINGPWDMTAVDDGSDATLFVTNVLNDIGAATPTSPVPGGTVVRISLELSKRHMPEVTKMRVVGEGISVRPDPNALVIGPTGVGLEGDTLYVVDSVNSQILAISDALDRNTPTTCRVVSAGNNLSDPLGMAIAPNGNIITVNGNDGQAVETTPAGAQVATATLDDNNGGGGNLFGLALTPNNHGLYFVDDFASDNSLFTAANS